MGCGTGILTRGLLSHPEWDIAALRASDPSEGMRATFSREVQDERVTVTDGTFDKTDADDGWADVILIATVEPYRSFADWVTY